MKLPRTANGCSARLPSSLRYANALLLLAIPPLPEYMPPPLYEGRAKGGEMTQQLEHVKQYEQAVALCDQEAVRNLFQAWRKEIWRVTCFGTWFQGPLVHIRECRNGVRFAIAVEDEDVTLTISAPFTHFQRTFGQREEEL